MSSPVERITENAVQTREQVTELLYALLDPLVAGFSPGFARVRIGYTGAHFDDAAADFEGFARPLWGLAPLLAGGGTYKEIHKWITGLANGTNPSHPEYWGEPVGTDQRLVEFAAVGYALALAPSTFWEPLSDVSKKNLTKWLLTINDRPLPTNNWRFFKVFVNVGLRNVGTEYSQSAIDETLDYIEVFYDKEGWPTDGPRPEVFQSDYYATSFAIPFYSIIYSKLAAESDPKRAALYRERAKKMALDVAHLFAPDGAHIPFGRSLTYRFATSAFWAAAVWAGLELPAPLTLGVIKGILLRNIRWFTQKESIFNADGTLTIGYAYPNQFLAEAYNSPQSPYWCLKAFLPLALSADHAFWQVKEDPYPESLLQVTKVVKSLNQVFSHAAGHTFLINGGQFCPWPIRQGAEKYSKLAYSSHFGFSVPTGASWVDQHALDSTFALCDDSTGERWRVNRRVLNASVSDAGVIEGEWSPWPDVHIKTWLIPPASADSAFHVRVHRVSSSRALKSIDGSFANYNQTGPPSLQRPMARFDGDPSSPQQDGILIVPGEALLVSSAGAVGIIDLFSDAPRGSSVENSDPNSNLIRPKAAIPMLLADIQGGTTDRWFVSAVFAIPFPEKGPRPDWVKLWKMKPKIPDFVPH